jgi:hypothetical protein
MDCRSSKYISGQVICVQNRNKKYGEYAKQFRAITD